MINRVSYYWSPELKLLRKKKCKSHEFSHSASAGEIMNKHLKYEDIHRLAICSRIIVFCIQLLALEFVHSHVNDGFKFVDDEAQGIFDRIVKRLFGGFTSWDGQYFLHITKYGYTEENTMAFFPLMPSIIWGLSLIVNNTLPVVSFSSTVILVSFFVNCFIFVKSAQLLHQLTPYFDHGLHSLSTLTVILFCFNPASIFFSAFYTESLFAFLTLRVLLCLYQRKKMQAVVYASLSCVCRSNGILNFGFCLAFSLRDALQKVEKGRGPFYRCLRSVQFLIMDGILIAIGLLPFVAFQIFCYLKFCNEEYVFPAKVPEFCAGFGSQLPYQYIQSNNWNVGFLRYFEIKQLPNFLLAAPVLYTTGQLIFPRFLRNLRRMIKNGNISCISDFAICCHGTFLTLFCLTCMHVQVSTRLIFSACPYLYIFIAKSIRTEIYRFRTESKQAIYFSLWIYGWFFSYFLLGSIAFPTGYPWT